MQQHLSLKIEFYLPWKDRWTPNEENIKFGSGKTTLFLLSISNWWYKEGIHSQNPRKGHQVHQELVEITQMLYSIIHLPSWGFKCTIPRISKTFWGLFSGKTHWSKNVQHFFFNPEFIARNHQNVRLYCRWLENRSHKPQNHQSRSLSKQSWRNLYINNILTFGIPALINSKFNWNSKT